MMNYPRSMDIRRLTEISTRAKTLLRENGIGTVQEFIDYFSTYGESGVSNFNKRRNAGKKTINELKDFVKDFLRDNDPYKDAKDINDMKSNIEKLKIAIAHMEIKLAELEKKQLTKQQEHVR